MFYYHVPQHSVRGEEVGIGTRIRMSSNPNSCRKWMIAANAVIVTFHVTALRSPLLRSGIGAFLLLPARYLFSALSILSQRLDNRLDVIPNHQSTAICLFRTAQTNSELASSPFAIVPQPRRAKSLNSGNDCYNNTGRRMLRKASSLVWLVPSGRR